MFLDGQGFHHFPEERLQIRDLYAEPEVSDRSTDIARGNAEDSFRDRRDATDTEIGAHHDDRDMGAREEVAEVVAELPQLEVPVVQLVVHGGQLFVGRLQLLLGGFQLFVRALQLLVARLRLLGGSAQLLHGRLVLFADGLQMLAGGGQFLGELDHPALAGRLRLRRALARKRGRGATSALLEEQDEMVAALHPFRGPDWDHLEADFPDPTVRPDALPLHPDRPTTLGRLLNRLAECGRQTFPRHLEEVEARGAWGRLEIGAGLPAELHDLHVGVHDDASRRIPPKDEMVSLLLDGRRAPARLPALRAGRRRDPVAGREAEAEVGRRCLFPREDLVLLVDDREEVREPTDAFRRAELQEAAGLQRVVEDRDDTLLQRGAEIDQHVAAAHEVEPRERWVPRHVLRCEDADVPDRLADPIAPVCFDEEPSQPVGRHLGLDARGKRPGPGPGDRGGAEVGGEHLDREVAVRLPEKLPQADHERVDLFARGAARDPDPDGLVGGPLLHEAREDAPPESFEPFRVPEESRHVNEDVVVQGLRFVRRLPEVLGIRFEVVGLLQEHAAGDPASDARRLVLREIGAGDGAHDTEDGADVGPFLQLGPAGGGWQGLPHVRVATDSRQLAGDLCRGQHEVGGRSRALGHPSMLRGFLVLDEGDAVRRLDRMEAERAVRTGPRQHHTDGETLLLLCERAEEVVDRLVVVDLGARRERQDAAADRHVGVRGDHVDVVRLHGQMVGDREDGHRRGSGQDIGQPALVRGVQVLDQHEGHAGISGKLFQKLAEGFKTAGGGADADDRERGSLRRLRGAVGVRSAGHGRIGPTLRRTAPRR